MSELENLLDGRDREFPRDLTPQERHDARLEARRIIDHVGVGHDRVFVMMHPEAPPRMPLPFLIDRHITAWRIELKIARATCPVHPEMVTILHLDEQIDGKPCPLCWAVAAFVPRPAPTPPPGPGRITSSP